MAVVCFDSNNSNVTDASEILPYLEEKEFHGTNVCELQILGLVDDEFMEPLSSLIRQNATFRDLQVLKLPRNLLSAACCNSIAHVLRSTAGSLTELDLSDNRIGEYPGSLTRRESSGSMCSHQSNSSASRQRRSSLTGDGLASLVEALSQPDCQLCTLRLGNNKLGAKSTMSIASIIRRASSLRSLDVSNNALGTKTIKSLIAPLQDNHRLQTLDLSYNNISDRGASLLATVLVSDESQCRLRQLNLTYNKIGPVGASSLARALLANRTLRTLDLSLNRIGPEGAECFGPVLRYSHTLRQLMLSRNNIGEGGQGVLKLLQGLELTEGTNLMHFDLSWNSLTDEAALHLARILSGNSALKRLNLSSNAIGNRGVKALAEALVYDVALRELNIVGNQADDASVEALSKVLRRPSSEKLRLLWEQNNFSPAGKRRLDAAIAFRRHLGTWLGRCLSDIATCREINLDLEEFPLGDDELITLTTDLVKYSSRVKVLRAAGNEFLTARGVCVLARDGLAPNHVALERIYLSCALIRDVGAGCLAQAVLFNTSIRVLSLATCGITSEGAKMLSNALRRNSSVQAVSLQGNDIGDVGARDICSAVLDKANPNILSLNLSGCKVTDGGLLLPPITKLESLFLSNNQISDAGALDLAKACIGCRSLQWLDCSENSLSKKGLQAIKLFAPVTCSFWSDNQRSTVDGNPRIN
jgi:Ran GTPase-activating protein (RanGAP) involved in mRNA processing and transport